jgi:hypothetical protein
MCTFNEISVIGASRIDTGQEDFYWSITFCKIVSGQEYDIGASSFAHDCNQ